GRPVQRASEFQLCYIYAMIITPKDPAECHLLDKSKTFNIALHSMINLTRPSFKDVLAQTMWVKSLDAQQMDRVERDMIERFVPAGAYLCRKGEAVEYWMGVTEG